MNILSPVTRKQNVVKVHSVDAADIIHGYQTAYSYDVTYLFANVQTLDLYECLDTGYRFYSPAIEGDAKFYEYLQQHDWYYMPWKWEHEQTLPYLRNGQTVLEIGCGKGDFLRTISNKFDVQCMGIETNKKAAQEGRENGIRISGELIQDYSEMHTQEFDVVCCFEVLEHIADVQSFINACARCLKPGGKFIVSVPNNDSFISETDNVLNMPPHHVGLWAEKSLRAIPLYYPLSLECVLKEPLQEYHREWFKQTVYTKGGGRNAFARTLSRLISRYSGFEKYLNYCMQWVIGHTIVAVYSTKVHPK